LINSKHKKESVSFVQYSNLWSSDFLISRNW